MHVQEIIRMHPHVRGNTNEAVIRCIEECYACASACTACSDACLGEDMVQQLTQCIPPRPRLRRCARRHRLRGNAPDRLERGDHPYYAAGLRRGLPCVRR